LHYRIQPVSLAKAIKFRNVVEEMVTTSKFV
jgi:hypothetical protein